MNTLKEINANVDAAITDLLAANANSQDVMITFELKLERAQEVMQQVRNSMNLSHGLRAELLTTEQAKVLMNAIDFIIRHTSDLITDLNAINGSGIHEVIEPTRYAMIVASILDTADQRWIGESMWRVMKSKVTKVTHFSDLYNAQPKSKEYDFGNTKSHEVPVKDFRNEPELPASA